MEVCKGSFLFWFLLNLCVFGAKNVCSLEFYVWWGRQYVCDFCLNFFVLGGKCYER